MMCSCAAYETVTGTEEEIHVIIRQMGESIKDKAVHSQWNKSGKCQLFIELNPVGVMVVRHGKWTWELELLNPPPRMPSYILESAEYVSLLLTDETRDRTNGV
jgi:hypothetical protein